MRPLRIVIADDEPVARRRLRRLIAERDDCLVVGEFENGIALAAGLAGLGADCILLDVDMPGPDGFATLAGLAGPPPIIVFVTAFAEFAARAYVVDAVDYLLKPVSVTRLDVALERVTRRLGETSQLAPTSVTPVIRFVAHGRVYLFDPSRLSSIQAIGNYVEITTDNQRVQLRMTLTEVAARLDPRAFSRVHRSWIVARAAMTQITSLPGARFDIRLKDGRRVPGGRAFSQYVTAAAYDHRPR